MFKLREKNDRKWCEDLRHNKNAARGKGGRRAVGVVDTQYDRYAICKSCYERIYSETKNE